MALRLLVMDWFYIVGTFAGLYFHPSLFTFVLGGVLLASRQHALYASLHESVHDNLAASKAWNKLIGAAFCAWPLGISYSGFKIYHHLHHRLLNSPVDLYWAATKDHPDWRFPMSARRFWTIALKDLLGVNFWSLLFFELKYLAQGENRLWRRLFHGLGFYVLLFGIATAASGSLAFGGACLAVWLVPKYTLHVWLIRIRTIAEHYHLDSDEHLARDIHASALERFFFAPYNVGLHGLHHEHPEIPAHRLKPESSMRLHGGYLTRGGVIRGLLQKDL